MTGNKTRKAVPNDAREIYKFTSDIFDAANYGCPKCPKDEAIRWWKSRLEVAHCRGVAFVSVDETNNPVGVVIVDHKENGQYRKHVGKLALAVHPDHRNKGVAKSLISHAEVYAKMQELSRLELFVWEENTAAIRAYSSAGYSIEGRHPMYGLRLGTCAEMLSMGKILAK